MQISTRASPASLAFSDEPGGVYMFCPLLGFRAFLNTCLRFMCLRQRLHGERSASPCPLAPVSHRGMQASLLAGRAGACDRSEKQASSGPYLRASPAVADKMRPKVAYCFKYTLFRFACADNEGRRRPGPHGFIAGFSILADQAAA